MLDIQIHSKEPTVFKFTRKSRRLMLALFESQMWCWGADIRRPEGNLLTEFGFTKIRPEGCGCGSTHYYFNQDSLSVHLWGFAALFTIPEFGTLTLYRHKWEPRWSKEILNLNNLWRAGDLPRLGMPTDSCDYERAAAIFKEAVSFMARYEVYVKNTVGDRYRADVFRSHPKPRRLYTTSSLVEGWKNFAEMQLGPT